MLKFHDLGIAELDHLPCIDIDQMIVVGLGGGLLVSRLGAPEIVAVDHAGPLQHTRGAIDRRETDVGVEHQGERMDGVDGRVVIRIGRVGPW